MQNKKIYQLYPKAVQDIESIYHYSLKEFGRKKAEQYVMDLEQGFQKMANTPEIWQHCDDIKVGLKATRVGSHIVFFKITISGIVVIRILHQSMDFIRHV